jgi:NAD kinase
MASGPKLVLVTRKTALEELLERHTTVSRARFAIEQAGGEFEPYQAAHDTYHAALDRIRTSLPREQRVQQVDRSFLPDFLFGDDDIVMVVGQDGLVVNAAKYLRTQPVIAVNPDPSRIDGVLLPFSVGTARLGLARVLAGTATCEHVTMAEARLNDGQSILAVNDLFVGARTHISARYRIGYRGAFEDQSSSGILVSTGAGSTGWLRSVYTAVAEIAAALGFREAGRLREEYRFDRQARELVFAVREPFVSRTSQASIVFGRISEDETLTVESKMPGHGVIFGDGVEEDYLEFNSGAIATIGVAARTLRLVCSSEVLPVRDDESHRSTKPAAMPVQALTDERR